MVLAPDGLSQATRLYPVDPGAQQAWAFELSDMIHSARSALDNAVYALALHHSGTLTPEQEKAVAFPARTSAGAFRKAGVTASLARLSPEARLDIEAAQPCVAIASRNVSSTVSIERSAM